MQVLGNLELLRKEIEKDYSRRFDEFKGESINTFNEEKKKTEEEHDKKIRKVKAELEAQKKKVFRTTLADEKLKAKKEFEERREQLISDVFKIAGKKYEKILLSKDYIDSIKSCIKEDKDLELQGSYEEYKQHFPDIEINKKLTGITVKQGNKIFDFTYNSFIESRKLDLRHKISKVLFEKPIKK